MEVTVCAAQRLGILVSWLTMAALGVGAGAQHGLPEKVTSTKPSGQDGLVLDLLTSNSSNTCRMEGDARMLAKDCLDPVGLVGSLIPEERWAHRLKAIVLVSQA